MIVNSCTFSLYFPANSDIREKFFDIEKHFTDFQKPFTLVPLPPDAPVEMPRIIAITDGGHSRLIVAGNCIQVQIKFDQYFNKDLAKCISYLSAKCSSIVKLLPIINDDNDNFYYSGITMEAYIDEILDPVSFMKNKFLNYQTKMKVEETQFKIATVAEDTYYINIVMQNESVFKGRPDEKGSFAGLSKIQDKLKVSLDINDKYAFNRIQEYSSDYARVRGILELIEEYADHKLERFMKEGEL